jgi:hypothetical protein
MPPRPKRSRGRGTAAAFGFLLLIGGLIAGAVMLVVASRLEQQAVEDFARAGVGCRTTLEFDATGTFYVYQETAGRFEVPDGNCEPVGQPDQAFGAEITGPAEAAFVPDESISYDASGFAGRSVSKVVIAEPGRYELTVRGADASVVAAVGRDPSSGVDTTRTAGFAVGAAGVVLGGLLLALAGRRSKKAAASGVPEGPGWGPARNEQDRAWPPKPPSVAQRPVNPQQPDEPARVSPPPPPLPARSPGGGERPAWAPPSADAPPVDEVPPAPRRPAPPIPPPEPTLPDR